MQAGCGWCGWVGGGGGGYSPWGAPHCASTYLPAVGRLPRDAAAVPHGAAGPPVPQVWVRSVEAAAVCCGLLGCSAQCGLSRGRAEALQPAPQAHHGSRNHLHAHNHTCRWGNRKSLVEDPAAAGIDVRGELLKYYWYAVFATVSMCLCVCCWDAQRAGGAGCSRSSDGRCRRVCCAHGPDPHTAWLLAAPPAPPVGSSTARSA